MRDDAGLRATRRAILAAFVGWIVALQPSETHAQFFGGGGRGGGGGIAAGSTFQGDVLRGEGIAAMGFGQYNYLSSMANSINTDTSIRLNEYIYQSYMNDIHKKAVHRQEHQKHVDEAHKSRLEQIREKPNQVDLRNGAALNVVLDTLLDPRISPSNYRKAVVPLAGDTIRKIPFQYAPRNATFSMARLEVTKALDWPLRLRDPAFDNFRRDYKSAVDAAIEHDHERKLSSADINRIKQAVTDFEIKVEQTIPQSNTTDFVQAKNHLKRLAEVPRMLNERSIEQIIMEIETYPGTSVGDLIAFMQRHNLRFGAADSPDENTLYADLFTSFVEQREQVTLPPDKDQPLR